MGGWIDLYTLPDLVVRAAERDREADALVFPHGRLSFGALHDRATAVARSLAAMGVGKGDHVGMVLPNMAEYVDVMLGTMYLGAWAVPINSRYKATELAYVIENADLKVLVTTDRIDEFVDYVHLLHDAFPDLAGQSDRRPSLARRSARPGGRGRHRRRAATEHRGVGRVRRPRRAHTGRRDRAPNASASPSATSPS